MSQEQSPEPEKQDFLEVDQEIPGQRFVCLSFLSPEALIEKKEAFNVCKFLQSYSKDKKLDYKELYSKYEDFVYKYSSELQRDFDEKNNFQTSLRGLKVRGTYSTKDEATERAKRLQTMDSNFHVFVGEVGKWLPWDPNADGVQDEVFQNSQLNEMMEKYQENNVNRDIFYEEQKREKVQAAREEALRKKREQEKDKADETSLEDKVYDVVDDVKKVVEDVEQVVEDVKETSETVEEIVHEVDSDIKESLEGADPWLANKLQQKKSVEPESSEPEPEPSDSEPEPVVPETKDEGGLDSDC